MTRKVGEKRLVRLFRNGRSQAVRIPKEFEFDTDSVEVVRSEGGVLILEPVQRKPKLLEALARLSPLSEEDWLVEVMDLPPEPVDLDLAAEDSK